MKNKDKLYMLDDRHECLTYKPNTCMWCEYLKFDGLTCSAFPDGIPIDILSGGIMHDMVLPNQTGVITFSQNS
jgi:hypothetical protein